MKRHAPKMMLVIALAALAVAIAVPISKNTDPYTVKKDYAAPHEAFRVDLGPVPGSLVSANSIDPNIASAPLDHRSFLIHMVKVHDAFKPIGLLIPALEQEPVDYFVMSYLPPPPPPPDLTGETHYIDVPSGSEWAKLVTKGGINYRGDILEQSDVTVKFRIQETDGHRQRPLVQQFPQAEIADLKPALKADQVFADQIAKAKGDGWKTAAVCCEALNRFGDLLKDNVVAVVKQGAIGGPDGPKGMLAVMLNPVLFSTAAPDKIQAYADMAEKNLAGKNDLASLKILAYLDMQVNKFGEAKKALDLAVANAPSDRSVLHMLAFVQLKMLDAPGALKTYTQLTTTDLEGTDYVAQIGKGMAQARAGDLDGASNTVAGIKPPVEDFTNRSMQALAGAEVAIGQSKLDDAAKALDVAAKDDTTTSRREMLLGIIAHKKEDDTEALKDFAAATDAKLGRIEPWAWFLYGILSEKADAANARTRFENAAKTAPFDPLIQMKLGDMASDSKDLTSAEKYYHRAVDLDPLDHRAWKRWIQSLPADRKIGTVNTWIDLLKASGDTGPVVWQAQAVRSIFELTAGSTTEAQASAQGVLDQQPDNVAALVCMAVIADRAADERGIKQSLETVLAKTQSASLSDWALKALNQVYLQGGEHLDYFNLRTEDADHIKYGKTFGAKSGIVREYKADGLTISGTPPDDKNSLVKFGFKIAGHDFMRVRLTVTTSNGVSEAGVWAGADCTTVSAFKFPTLGVGIANGRMESMLYRKADSQWQEINDENVRGLKGAKDTFDGVTLTYAIELTDPVKGIFAVTINGQDAGNTSATPLGDDFKLSMMQMAAGGFVKGSANLPFKVRFENLIIVSQATADNTATVAPDTGLVKPGPAVDKAP